MNRQIEQLPQRATLYYDGRCPICVREMARLGRLKSAELELVDIHCAPAVPALPDRDTLLRDLHLRLPGGRLLTGVDANVAAWQFTRFGWCLRWLRWPLLRRVSDRAYRGWARWRYQRLYQRRCSAGPDQ